MNNRRMMLLNSFALYGRTLILMFVTLYTSRMALNSLGVSDFGLYSLVSSVILLFTFIQNVFSLSTQRFLTVEVAKESEQFEKRFASIIIMYLGICILVFFLAETVGLWFVLSQVNSSTVSTNDIFLLYQFTIITLLFQIMQTPFMGYFLATEKMSVFAKVGVFDAFQRWLMVFIFSSFDFQNKVVSYSCLVLIGFVFVFIVYVYFCSKYVRLYRGFFSRDIDMIFLKEVLLFSRWPLLGAFSIVSVSQSIAFLAYYFVGLVANASIWLAEQVLNAFNRVTGALQMAFAPKIIKSGSLGYYDEMNGLIFLSCKLTAFVTILSGVPVFVFADFVSTVWLGDVPDYLPGFIRIVIVYAFIDSLSNPFVTAIYTKGELKRYQLVISLILGFSVLLMTALFFLHYSIYFVLLIRVLCVLVLLVLRVLWTQSIFPLCNLNFFLFKLLPKFFIVAIISVLTCLYIKNEVLDGYFSLLMVSFFNLLLVAVMFFFIVFDADDRASFLKLLRKLKCS